MSSPVRGGVRGGGVGGLNVTKSSKFDVGNILCMYMYVQPLVASSFVGPFVASPLLHGSFGKRRLKIFSCVCRVFFSHFWPCKFPAVAPTEKMRLNWR